MVPYYITPAKTQMTHFTVVIKYVSQFKNRKKKLPNIISIVHSSYMYIYTVHLRKAHTVLQFMAF